MSLEKVEENDVSRAEGSMVSRATGTGLREREGRNGERRLRQVFSKRFLLICCVVGNSGCKRGFEDGRKDRVCALLGKSRRRGKESGCSWRGRGGGC